MAAPFLFRTTTETRLRLARWALLGLFAGLGILNVLQARMVLTYTTAKRPSVGSLAETMQSRFNAISLGIMSYLETHDMPSLEHIKSEGQETGRLLEKLKAKALEQGNSAATLPIEKAAGASLAPSPHIPTVWPLF